MSFDRFTERSRRVMAMANQAATRFKHEYITVEVILLALLQEGSGVGANALRNLGVKTDEAQAELETILRSGAPGLGGASDTPRTKTVVTQAMNEARRLGHDFVGTEHLLLGILHDQGPAARTLAKLGVTLETARAEVASILGGTPANAPTLPAALALPAELSLPVRPPAPPALRRWLDNFTASFRFDFPGPVFHKEMRGSQRKFAAFGGRMTYVLLLAGILWIVYASVRANADRSASPVQILQSLQSIAPALTASVLGVQASLLTLLAPSMTASAFSDERRKRTLDVLLTTPIRPWQIVWGKLLAGVAALAVLALCALPVLLAVRVFGGLDATQIAGSFALSLSLGTVMASLAMFNSLWCKKSSTSVFLAFVFFAILQGLPLLVMTTITAITGASGGPPSGIALYAFYCCSPIAVVFLCLEIVGAGVPFPVGEAWAAASLYNLAVSALIVLLTTAILRRVMLRLAAGDSPAVVAIGRIPADKPDADRDAPNPRPDGAPARRKRPIPGRKVSRTVGDRPVLWRELSQPLFRRPVLAILSIIALAGFSLWIFLVSTIAGSTAEPHIFSTNMIFAVILLLQAASLTVAGFPAERESKTWEVLLTAPLSPRDLVLGKFAGALRSLWLMPSALLVNLALLGVVAGYLRPIILIQTVLIFGGPVLLLAASGTRLSLAAKSSTAAGMRNTGVALLLWAGAPILAGLGQLASRAYDLRQTPVGWFVDTFTHIAFFFNPIWNFGGCLENSITNRSYSRDIPIGGPDSHLSVGPGPFTVIMFGSFLAYALAALLTLRWSSAVFIKKSGRTS